MNKQDFVDALSEGQALAAAASAAQCAQNKQVRDALDEMARALGLPTDWVSYDDPPKVDRFGIVHLHRAQSICIDDTPIGVVHPSHNHWVDDGTGKFGPLTELLADMLKRPGAARAVRAAREKIVRLYAEASSARRTSLLVSSVFSVLAIAACAAAWLLPPPASVLDILGLVFAIVAAFAVMFTRDAARCVRELEPFVGFARSQLTGPLTIP